ncbi:MAG: hypothetical protein IJA41_03620 [Clostridia bacterium]|nr:hypothetical protein [Clostridia bacterium]
MKNYVKPQFDVISAVPNTDIAYGDNDDIIVNPDPWGDISAIGADYPDDMF